MLKFENQTGKSLGCLPIIGLLLLTIILTIGGTVWAIQSNFFARNFKPVELSEKEELSLQQKLDALSSTESSLGQTSQDLVATDTSLPDSPGVDDDKPNNTSNTKLEPEVYTEDDSKRRIELTERELNALLAKNTDLAEQLVVHLSDNTASVRLLQELDPDLPFFGGKTLKASGAAELSYQNGRPVIILKGVSIWGVPVPSAYLGNLKNIDLVSEFGGSDGFWKSLADGIEDIQIKDGSLFIQLAE